MMKKILAILLLATALTAPAQDAVSFINDDYAQAMRRAVSEDKLVFVMVHAEWCPHCDKMKKGTLKDPQVGAFFNENFVNLMVDSEQQFGKRFMRKYNVRSFPHFIFLNKKQEVVYRLGGADFSPAQLIAEGKNALNPEMHLTFLEMQFIQDMSNTRKCLDYLEVLKKGRDREQQSQVALAYLQTRKPESLFNADDWKIIVAGVNDFYSPEFQFLLSHQKEFAAVSSPRRVENKILNVVLSMQKEAIDKLDSAQYNKNRIAINNLRIPRADSIAFRQDLRFYPQVKDWDRYVQATLASTDKYLSTDYRALNEITTNYFAGVSDAEALREAVRWAILSNELNETHESNFILAKLHQKLQNRKEALEYARRSKAIIDKMGWDDEKVSGLIDALGGAAN